MALLIDHPEVDKLAQELAAYTGESITQAITNALRERLMRQKRINQPLTLAEELLRIGRECAALPMLDARTPEEILGYDQIGVSA